MIIRYELVTIRSNSCAIRSNGKLFIQTDSGSNGIINPFKWNINPFERNTVRLKSGLYWESPVALFVTSNRLTKMEAVCLLRSNDRAGRRDLYLFCER